MSSNFGTLLGLRGLVVREGFSFPLRNRSSPRRRNSSSQARNISKNVNKSPYSRFSPSHFSSYFCRWETRFAGKGTSEQEVRACCYEPPFLPLVAIVGQNSYKQEVAGPSRPLPPSDKQPRLSALRFTKTEQIVHFIILSDFSRYDPLGTTANERVHSRPLTCRR
jgi:hypothetical protein